MNPTSQFCSRQVESPDQRSHLGYLERGVFGVSSLLLSYTQRRDLAAWESHVGSLLLPQICCEIFVSLLNHLSLSLLSFNTTCFPLFVFCFPEKK